MASRPRKQSGLPALRKLKKTLTEIATTAPSRTFSEGERYVCAVCQDTVKLCNADPTIHCPHMILIGTELQLLQDGGKSKAACCISCGASLSKRLLQKNPLAELCPDCQKTSKKSKLSRQ